MDHTSFPEACAFDALATIYSIDYSKNTELEVVGKKIKNFVANKAIREAFSERFMLMAAALRAYIRQRPYSIYLTKSHTIQDESEAEAIAREAFYTIYGKGSGDTYMWELILFSKYDPLSNATHNPHDPQLEVEPNSKEGQKYFMDKDINSFTRKDIHNCINQVRRAVPILEECRKSVANFDDESKRRFVDHVLYRIEKIFYWAQRSEKWEVVYGVLSDAAFRRSYRLATASKSARSNRMILSAPTPGAYGPFRTQAEAANAENQLNVQRDIDGSYIPRTNSRMANKLISLWDVKEKPIDTFVLYASDSEVESEEE